MIVLCSSVPSARDKTRWLKCFCPYICVCMFLECHWSTLQNLTLCVQSNCSSDHLSSKFMQNPPWNNAIHFEYNLRVSPSKYYGIVQLHCHSGFSISLPKWNHLFPRATATKDQCSEVFGKTSNTICNAIWFSWISRDQVLCLKYKNCDNLDSRSTQKHARGSCMGTMGSVPWLHAELLSSASGHGQHAHVWTMNLKNICLYPWTHPGVTMTVYVRHSLQICTHVRNMSGCSSMSWCVMGTLEWQRPHACTCQPSSRYQGTMVYHTMPDMHAAQLTRSSGLHQMKI